MKMRVLHACCTPGLPGQPNGQKFLNTLPCAKSAVGWLCCEQFLKKEEILFWKTAYSPGTMTAKGRLHHNGWCWNMSVHKCSRYCDRSTRRARWGESGSCIHLLRIKKWSGERLLSAYRCIQPYEDDCSRIWLQYGILVGRWQQWI